MNNVQVVIRVVVNRINAVADNGAIRKERKLQLPVNDRREFKTAGWVLFKDSER